VEDALKTAIERQAKKLLERQKREHFASIKYKRRFRLRTGATPIDSEDRDPGLWSVSAHFNPIYCIRHSKYLARVIWKKIIERSYEVKPAVLFEVPKDNGGFREIMVFSIPDAAVANLFNRKLRDRNRNLQSPFCYSYRKDRTIFDAILQTSSLLKGDKLYVIQFDFARYFDSIRHEYINFIMEKNLFLISPAEKFVINQFLKHRFAKLKDYRIEKFSTREVGVPQGSSLSLFLSNIAAHELDIDLARLNGMFVRFADDIVCVALEFGDASAITHAFKEHCYYSGISINFEKSPGICLLEGLARGNN
jgi:hypothetical protein